MAAEGADKRGALAKRSRKKKAPPLGKECC